MTKTPKNAAPGKKPSKQPMLPTDRIAYSPINERPALKLPDGARMVVWVIVNVEEWDPTQPMPRTVLTPPAGGSPMPDVPNWAWHEYGNRVGFWRFVEVFDALSIPAVLAINGSALAAYPAIVRAALDREWEFMGHGFTQRNMQKVEDERADIRKTREVIREATGKPPRGWLGPGLTETWETPDLLVEEGYDYVADWVLDDQPVWLRTRSSPLLNLPYTQECNDVAMMLIQHHKASEYSDRALDQFEQIYADAAGFGARHGARGPPLHHGRAAPAEIFSPRAGSDARKTRREILDRRADCRLVSFGGTRSAGTIRRRCGRINRAAGASAKCRYLRFTGHVRMRVPGVWRAWPFMAASSARSPRRCGHWDRCAGTRRSRRMFWRLLPLPPVSRCCAPAPPRCAITSRAG